MPDKRPKDFMVVDDAGTVWEPAETIREGAEHAHTTPKRQAKQDAQAMTAQTVGGSFHAVRAKPKKKDPVMPPGSGKI